MSPPRGPELSQGQRDRICELRSLGWGPTRIHKHHPEIKLCTIKSTLQKEKKRDNNKSQSRSGAPRKLTEEDRDHIYDTINHTNPQIQHRDLLREVDNKIKTRSLRYLLRELGRRKWLQKRRPMLTAEHARKRLNWALHHQRWTSIWWRQVWWSDECTVERGIGIQPIWTFTRPCNQTKLGDVKEVRCGKGVKKMLWAAFSYNRRTGLVPLNGDEASKKKGVTGRVVRALYEAFLPEIIGPHDTFMHDNARVHTAKIVKESLAELRIKVMVWPPYSPDLNPIENLWAIMKRHIYQRYPWLEKAPDTIATLEALIKAAQESWHLISTEILRNASDGMPKRVEAIIAAEGWYTDK